MENTVTETETIKCPVKVEYCPNCSMPFEYCEYYPDFENCKKWLQKNLPDMFSKMYVSSASEIRGQPEGDSKGDENPEGDDQDEEGKKRQKRGGKGIVKAKKKEAEVEKRITLSIAPRGKKKSVTVVQGLKTFGIDLKVASKFFGTKFACGASITGDDEIVIQGDCKDELFDIIPEKWPEVDEDAIEDLGSKKR